MNYLLEFGHSKVFMWAGPERGQMEPGSVTNVGPQPLSENNINILIYI
jgi:hypothetical protein